VLFRRRLGHGDVIAQDVTAFLLSAEFGRELAGAFFRRGLQEPESFDDLKIRSR
jgi:hypothetical protein